MRITVLNAALFLLSTFFVCAYLKMIGEGNSSGIQLTFATWGEEAARQYLSRRSGKPIHIYAVIIAAAPLDWILHQASPSWPLFGVGPCDKRRTKLTDNGGCTASHAYACYRHSASGKIDFGTMAACYEILDIPAGEAKNHVKQCHKDEELAWQGVASCVSVQTRRFEQRNQSFAWMYVFVQCVERFGVIEELSKALLRYQLPEERELRPKNENEWEDSTLRHESGLPRSDRSR